MKRSLMITVTAAVLAGWCAPAAGASTTWAIQATPNPSGATGTTLAGVSCASATRCVAVGSYTNGGGHSQTALALAEYWNGST
jgi:hypothetical protein